MANLVKQHIHTNGVISVELYDKTDKRCDYNWLVEFAVNGRSTAKSDTFVDESDALDYYNDLVSDDTLYINIL